MIEICKDLIYSNCEKTVVTDPREGIVDWTVLMLVILPIVACFIDIRESFMD